MQEIRAFGLGAPSEEASGAFSTCRVSGTLVVLVEICNLAIGQGDL